MTLDDYIKWSNEVIEPLNTEDPEPPDYGIRIKALVNGKLAEVLHGREYQYISEDWKDSSGFIDSILNDNWLRTHYLATKKQYGPFEQVRGGHGGSDDFVLIAIDDENVDDDELDIVFDLVHNLGAEIR